VAVHRAEIEDTVRPAEEPGPPALPLSRAMEADLRDRGLVERSPEGGLRLTDRVEAAVVEILGRSRLQLEVVHASETGTQRRWYALTSRAGVALAPVGSDWSLEPLLTRDILLRLRADLGLSARPTARTGALTVIGAQLERCAGRLQLGDRAGAEQALLGPEAPAAGVRAFVSALAGKVSTTAVIRTTSDPEQGVTSRRAIAWLDGGEGGLWAVPVPGREGDESAQQITPLRFAEVFVAVARLLPLDDHPDWREILLPDPADPAAGRVTPPTGP
jgi:hypothetical protein